MAENTSEDDLLKEDISVENNLEGMATGSKSSTVLSENAELMTLLTSMNETIKAMSESLRGSGETPTPKPADSAKRGRKTNNGSYDLLSDSAESNLERPAFGIKQAPKKPGWRRRRRYLARRDRTVNE